MSLDLPIYTDDLYFKEYLSIETATKSDNIYTFLNNEHAISVIGQFIYYKIKNELLNDLFSDFDDIETEKNSFNLFIPIEIEHEWKKEMFTMFNEFFYHTKPKELHIDGLITFRFNKFKHNLYSYLTEELTYYYESTETSTSIQSLIEFMNEREITEEPIYIETKESGDIVLKKQEECIFLEQDNCQENIIVQSVFVSPSKVHVIDEFKILKKETVIVLKQLFGHRISFYRTKEHLSQLNK